MRAAQDVLRQSHTSFDPLLPREHATRLPFQDAASNLEFLPFPLDLLPVLVYSRRQSRRQVLSQLFLFYHFLSLSHLLRHSLDQWDPHRFGSLPFRQLRSDQEFHRLEQTLVFHHRLILGPDRLLAHREWRVSMNRNYNVLKRYISHLFHQMMFLVAKLRESIVDDEVYWMRLGLLV